MESYFYHSIKKNGYGISGSALRIGHTPSLPVLSEPLLKKAAQQLKENHPFLRCKITLNRKGHPQFEHHQNQQNGPTIPIHMIESDDATLWKNLLSDEIRQPIHPEKESLIRFILIKNVNPSDRSISSIDLLHIYHHSISDATSSLALMEEFLQAALAIAADETADEKHASTTLSHPPNSTKRLSTLKALAEHQPERYRHFKLMSAKPDYALSLSTRTPLLSPALPPQHKTAAGPTLSIARTLISNEETQALVSACRRHNTTMYGALTAASLLACAKVLPKSFGNYQLMTLSNPISLRDRVSPSIDRHALGAYVSVIEQKILLQASKDAFWDLAQTCRNGLINALNKGEHQQFYSFIKNLIKMLWEPSLLLFDSAPPTLLVNSLGRCTLSGDIDWQAFSWATHMASSSPGIAVYSATLNGTMSLSVQSERFKQAALELIMTNLLQTLSEACLNAT